MAIIAKAFIAFDACGTPGFVYDAGGNDITTPQRLGKIRALYDAQKDGGPWKKSWCLAATHQAGVAANIDAELETNLAE